jgi:hypothetical protein
LERIQQYIYIEQEPKPTEAGKPPAYWPSSGELIVEKLSARYSPDGPKVLRDISFRVNAGERIGIGAFHLWFPAHSEGALKWAARDLAKYIIFFGPSDD